MLHTDTDQAFLTMTRHLSKRVQSSRRISDEMLVTMISPKVVRVARRPSRDVWIVVRLHLSMVQTLFYWTICWKYRRKINTISSLWSKFYENAFMHEPAIFSGKSRFLIFIVDKNFNLEKIWLIEVTACSLFFCLFLFLFIRFVHTIITRVPVLKCESSVISLYKW